MRCARRSRRIAQGKGELIVLNDEINAARDTTKTNTLRVETFRAPELGLLGYVDEDKVSFYRATTKRHTSNSEFDVTALDVSCRRCRSCIRTSNRTPTLIQAAINGGAKGIVFAGTGNGALSIFEDDAVKEVTRCRPRRGRRWCDRAASATAA